MAKVTRSDGQEPTIGRVGEWIFRRHMGFTVVSRYVPSGKPPSVAQRQMRSRFKEAAAYAKSVVGTPVWTEVYANYAREKRISVFSAAITDFMKPPVIETVDATAYQGVTGD